MSVIEHFKANRARFGDDERAEAIETLLARLAAAPETVRLNEDEIKAFRKREADALSVEGTGAFIEAMRGLAAECANRGQIHQAARLVDAVGKRLQQEGMEARAYFDEARALLGQGDDNADGLYRQAIHLICVLYSDVGVKLDW